MDWQKQIEELKKEVQLLKERRVTQEMVVPGAIKQRAIGEGGRWVRSGVTAGKPTTGETAPASSAVYFDNTLSKLWVYNGTSWVGVLLT